MAQEPDLNEAATSPEPPWPTLKCPDLKDTEFEANGVVYRVYRSISPDRWEMYEQLQIEIGLARTFQQVMDGVQEAYGLCNKVASGKPVFADLAVTLRDIIIGVTMVGERQHPAVLRMAALFINRKDEDIRFINEDMIQQKIDDWRKGGIDMKYFFQFALASIPGFFDAYKAVSQAFSELKTGAYQQDRSNTSNNDAQP